MRHRALLVLLIAALVAATGCSATQQQYTVVPVPQMDVMIGERKVVVEVVVEQSRMSSDWSLSQPLGNGRWRRDAVVAASRVIKGEETATRLKLSNYRELTEQESAAFPDGYGIHNNSRLLLGYDSRWGNSFKNLCIVPLGNTPEFDDALRQAAMMRARRAATHPSSQRSN
jgi:hypothetical protein